MSRQSTRGQCPRPTDELQRGGRLEHPQARGSGRRHLCGRHDATGPGPGRSGPGRRQVRRRPPGAAWRLAAGRRHVLHELFDSWHLLGASTDAARSIGTGQPQLHLDSPGLLARGHLGSVRDRASHPAVTPSLTPALVNRMPAVVEAQAQSRGALSGKVAVVVGGASGIGRTVANAIARQGARVVIADFDSERMERTVEEILELGIADALALSTDVRSDASVRAMAGDAIKAMGQVDILINMAGVLLEGPLQRIKTSDWKWMLQTNLLGAVRTTTALMPHMMERRSGHIVNAVSADGPAPHDPLTVAYDAGHAALAAFTRSLATELDGTGVNVSLYCTGSRGPRIGQNTRSRGVSRLLHRGEGTDVEEQSKPTDQLVDSLIDALHHPRFLVLAEPRR